MTELQERIHTLYHVHDYNCARTTLLCLGERFGIPISQQVFNAAIGMHGAGFFRAQCGLVEGALMFFGLWGTEKGMTEEEIGKLCYRFAETFTERFGSLLCRELRPGGFQKTDPPHLCETLTEMSIAFTMDFLEQYQNSHPAE